MVRNLQIAQTRRDDGGQSPDRRSPNELRCMWCDNVDHIQKDYADFAEALKNSVIYLWNGGVHASEMRRPLEMNIGRGGMKRLMDDVVRPTLTVTDIV